MVINHLGQERQVYGSGRFCGYIECSGVVNEVVVGSSSCDRFSYRGGVKCLYVYQW